MGCGGSSKPNVVPTPDHVGLEKIVDGEIETVPLSSLTLCQETPYDLVNRKLSLVAKNHIRSTWPQVYANPDAGRIFYDTLFSIKPELRDKFQVVHTMEEISVMLMNKLDVCVEQIDNPEVLVSVLQLLGRSHRKYHVEVPDFDFVGAALVKTLQNSLESRFTLAVQSAYIEFYGLITMIMREELAKTPVLSLKRKMSDRFAIMEPVKEVPSHIENAEEKRVIIENSPKSAILEASTDTSPSNRMPPMDLLHHRSFPPNVVSSNDQPSVE